MLRFSLVIANSAFGLLIGNLKCFEKMFSLFFLETDSLNEMFSFTASVSMNCIID